MTTRTQGLLAGVLCGALLSLIPGCASTPPAADLVLLGGKLVTLDPGRPEAEALAARDGRIVAVGSDAEIRAYVGDGTEIVELDGRLAIPGFIESHAHFPGLGRSKMALEVGSAKSWDEVVERVAAAAREAEPGAWISGWGWHQEKWSSPPEPNVDGYPTHAELNRVAPDNPVILKHAAGSHGGILNDLALARLGFDATTPDPPGGELLRDSRGQLTGVLRDAAYEMAKAAYLADRGDLIVQEIELADRECLSKGVTTFQDAGSAFETIDRMIEMAAAGRLGVRLWVMILDEHERLAGRIADYRMVGAHDDHLTVRAVKGEIDGALGSHSAWLLEPYSDLPDSVGLNTSTVGELEETARIAAEHDFQLCVHAIGDRGNQEILDLFERSGGPDRRWRIEHAQHLHPDDIPRFAELGVIASMQGVHCTSDGGWVPRRLGEQRSREGAYVWRSLIDSGATICNGTDAPIEDVDPIANYYSTVTRNIAPGQAFYPEQRMTRMEALESYTINAAYAGFEESIKGSLVPGKLADVVVLSRDILTVPEEQIPDAEVLYTIVGGEVLYRRGDPEE